MYPTMKLVLLTFLGSCLIAQANSSESCPSSCTVEEIAATESAVAFEKKAQPSYCFAIENDCCPNPRTGKKCRAFLPSCPSKCFSHSVEAAVKLCTSHNQGKEEVCEVVGANIDDHKWQSDNCGTDRNKLVETIQKAGLVVVEGTEE